MKAKCKKCGDTVEVTRPREFKSCKCGAIYLDYGNEFYYRVGGNPDAFDGEIEDAPAIHDGYINISHYPEPTKEDYIKAREYLSTAVRVKESFTNVNVDLGEDGTLLINDAKTDEQLAKFKVVEGE